MRYLTPMLLALHLVSLAAAAPSLSLVANGRSAYVIYCSPDAPPSAKLAAREFQRLVKGSTGVELPLAEAPAKPMVCVGNNPASAAAGLKTDDLPHDAFRIVTKDGNLYLLGRDFPNDQYQQRGWTSRGTLNAVCDFCERFIGVRWLMPGDVGEEIPQSAKLVVPALNEKQQPFFPVRCLMDVQDRRPGGDKSPNLAAEWLLRQKMPTLNDGHRMDDSHFWIIHVPQEVWKPHPEWLSKDETGKPRDYTKHPAGVKFCTLNQELVQTFAAGVIKFIESHPNWKYVPISPSDGGDFCECAECKKLVVTDPNGRPSYTPLLLKFYNDVAKIVGARHPEVGLPGYVYYNYMYPPPTPVKMEPNVWLVQAPLNYYGYGLLKPVYRAEFPRVIEGWLKITPNFVYHNYSNWMRSYNGAPLPTAIDILELELPTVAKYGGKGAKMLGLGAWGVGAPTNYIYAKQMWDPKINVAKMYDEWLRVAYGPAYEPMRKLRDLADQRFIAYKSTETPVYRGHMYEMNYEKAELIYLPIFPQMEKLYLEALSKPLTDKQKKRLELFGENLLQLHWGMRTAGMQLPEAEKSYFYRTDEQYKQFMEERVFSVYIYRDHGKRYVGPIWKGEWSG